MQLERTSHPRHLRFLSPLATLALLVAAPAAFPQAHFRRGDTNGDGRVDVADLVWEARNTGEIPCEEAYRVTNSPGGFGWPFFMDEQARLWCYLFACFEEVGPIPAPGPLEPGPDPEGDPCRTYPSPQPPVSARVAYGFEGCPEVIEGRLGDAVTLEVDVALSILGDAIVPGIPAWSFSVAAEGGEVLEAFFAEPVRTVRSSDCSAEPVDPFWLDLVSSSYDARIDIRYLTETATRPGGGVGGAVSAVLLDTWSVTIGDHCRYGVLHLSHPGTYRVARLRVRATVPSELTLRFEDGLQGSGQPVLNVVAVTEGPGWPRPPAVSVTPELSSCTIRLVEADCNRNGAPDSVDIASGSSSDVDGSGIPDECEPDCDQNGISDALEIEGGALDCDRNGVLDACDIATGASRDCNRNGIPDGCDLEGVISVAPALKWPGRSSHGHVMLDADGDGDTDVLGLIHEDPDGDGQYESSVMLFQYGGDGSFAAGGASAYPNDYYHPSESWAIEDLDGDRFADLAIPYGSTLQLLLGGADGTFVPSGVVTFGTDNVNEAAARDLDRDGDADLVVRTSNAAGTAAYLAILKNDGAGSFAAPAKVTLGSSAGGFSIADLDGDRAPDILAGTYSSAGDSRLSVHLNRGDGSFRAATHYTDSPSYLPDALADLDGDGDLDLAWSGRSGSDSWGDWYLYPPRVRRNRGDGSVEAAVEGEPSPEHLAAIGPLRAGDLDGDGKADLWMAARAVHESTPRGILVYPGSESGALGAPRLYRAGELPMIGLSPPVGADLDGDGDLDLLAVSTRALIVFVNDGAGSLDAIRLPWVGADGGALTLEDGTVPDLLLGDFDGDGLEDLLVAGTQNLPLPFLNAGFPPSTGDADRDGVPDECTGSGLQLPSDANQDASVDLSDAVWLLGHLFLGDHPTLPCEGGTAAAPGPGELALLDSNGDGGIDLSDAVLVLGWLFLGQGNSAPVLGRTCTPIAGCPDACGP